MSIMNPIVIHLAYEEIDTMRKICDFVYNDITIHLYEDKTKRTYLYQALVETDSEEWETDWIASLPEAVLEATHWVDNLEYRTRLSI